uniref:Obscurin-like protein 1 n=1 Tax=Cyprinus carpio TaxID=7962 RepID=A0A8C2KXV9_CYPCA
MDVFGGAPRFLAYPRPVVVQSGTDAVLKCQIGGDPRPAVIWERNNEKIHPEGRYRVFEDGNIYNLIITSVTMEDSGQYICKAKNWIGETYAAATLKVEGEAQEMEFREENKPRFLIKPLSTRVGRGEDAVFSCKLWGNPRPEVMWEKDGKKLNEIFESTHFAISYQDGGWFQLKIFKTRAPDGGVYTCKARNEFGESLAGAVLLVDAGPGHEDEGNPKVKMFAVTEGKHAKFRCYVTGKPKPEILWRKDGRLILSGRRYLLYEDREGYFTLKVLYCKQQDNGVYVCSASNTAGQTLSAVHLIIKEPPVRFKQPLNDLQVWERDLAVLECEVPEDSVPITWYLEDRRLQPGAKYGMEEWGTKRRLTIRDIGVDDDGIYLCEMADGGRSIAEVAVKGKKKKKTSTTSAWEKPILKSCHEKLTSSLVIISAARHCPPSCPIGVQINTERANAALLSWYPAQDSRKNPPSGYIIERQEVGSQEWLQCLTTDSATSVEILGDSVPCEADYRFRICSVNKYGRSGNVEFPRAVHLVPVARIQAPLQDALVPEGQDACFTIELSASVIGTWFLNGNQLQDDDRFSIRRSRTHQSLRIRGVRDTDNGAEITFIAYGIRDSAALYIQAPPVRFSILPEDERNKSIEAGSPIALQCELSDPLAQVSWYKDGVKLLLQSGLDFKSKGTKRQLIVQSAEFYHSGVYSCKTRGDAVHFNVDVKVPPPTFLADPEVEKTKCWPVILQCEISDPTALVQWYKDGLQLLPQSGVYIQSQHTMRTLVIQSANLSHSGFYSCNTADDISEFFVEVKGDIQYPKNIVEQDNLLLCCQVSRSDATAQWYKDGVELKPSGNVLIEAENTIRRVIVLSSQLSDSGTYTCRAGDSALTFKVNVREPPVMIVYPKEDVHLDRYVPEEIVLSCELSRPNGKVTWFKDGQKLQESENIKLKSEGPYRRLKILRSGVEDTGEYVCDTADDSIFFNLNIKEPPVRIVSPSQSQMELCQQTSERMVLSCEISRPNATVRWYRDGLEVEESDSLILEVDGVYRRLIIPKPTVKDSAEYVCDTADDSVTFFVNIAEPPVRFIRPRKMAYGVEKLVGDILVLECEVSRPNAEVSWKKDGEEIEENSNITITEDGTSRQLTIHSATFEDAGLKCFDESITKTNSNFTFFLPDPPLKILRKADIEIKRRFVVSDAIVLKCEISRPNGVVSWLKDNEKIEGNEHFICEEEGTFRSLIVLSAELKDSGEYICDAQDDKVVFSVTVEEPPFKFIKKDERTNISANEEDTVTLRATVNRVNAPVKWLRGHDTVRGDRFHTTSDGNTHYLTINPLKRSDTGEYTCHVGSDEKQFSVHIKGKTREWAVKFYSSTKLKFSKPLENVVGLKGSDVVLKCELYKSKGDVQWLKGSQEIAPNRHFTIRAEGRVRSLTIHDVTEDDAGEYACESKDERTSATVVVNSKLNSTKGLPMDPVVAEEFGEATLEVEVSLETAEVQWMRQGVVIHPGSKFTLKQNGQKRSLTIHKLTLSDRGTYSCETLHDSTQAKLTVERESALLLSFSLCAVTYERETASFEVELSHGNVDGVWQKDGHILKNNNRLRMTAKGRVHSLTISNLTLDDTGTYIFSVENIKSLARLERELEILQSLEDLDIQEGQNAVFMCEVSLEDVPGEWFKNGEKIKPTSTIKFRQEGTKHFLLICNVKEDDSGEIKFVAKNVETTAYLEVEALPANIVKPLQDKTALEKTRVILDCTVTNPRCSIRWYKGPNVILPSERFEICSEGCYRKLVIQQVLLEDEGTYSVQVGNYTSSAKLTVEGEANSALLHQLWID